MPPQMPQFFQVKNFNQGQVIFREGQDASYACIVNNGQVEVLKEVDGQQVPLARLGKGAVFGEMALISQDRRTATVVAATFTEVVLLERERFQKTLATSNPLIQALIRGLVERLAHTNSLLQADPNQRPRVVALAFLIEALTECAPTDEQGRARLPLRRLVQQSDNILEIGTKELEKLLLQLTALGPLTIERGVQGRELALEMPSKLSIKLRNLLEKPPETANGQTASPPDADA